MQWYSWPEVLGAQHDSAGGYVLAYLCYVIWALALGLLAVRMVRTFAPYACGSGIPEVSRAAWEAGRRRGGVCYSGKHLWHVRSRSCVCLVAVFFFT